LRICRSNSASLSTCVSRASGIPSFAEPFFAELNASLELAPVMNGDDLQKGLSQLG
jgi:hypothetical protein